MHWVRALNKLDVEEHLCNTGRHCTFGSRVSSVRMKKIINQADSNKSVKKVQSGATSATHLDLCRHPVTFD